MRTRPRILTRVLWMLAIAVAACLAVLAHSVLLGSVALIAGAMYLAPVRELARRGLYSAIRIARRWRGRSRTHRRLRNTAWLRQQQYAELRALVENVDGHERVELEELLERFVHCAAVHEQCVAALARAIASDVCGDVIGPLADDRRAPRVREIRARRWRDRQEQLRRADQIADDLDTLAEVVQLFVERAASPPDDPGIEDEVNRRLELLDDTDVALAVLAAPDAARPAAAGAT